VNAVVFDSM